MNLRLLAVLALGSVSVLAACSSGGGSGPGRPHTSGPSAPTTGGSTSTNPPAVSDAAAVFVAVLGGSHPKPSGAGPRTYIRDHTVCSQMLRQRPCPAVRIPDAVRDEIVAALGPRVIFTPSPPTRKLSPGTRIAVTLGAPKIDGDRAYVSVETNCGPLCGLGETVVLARHGDVWMRTGSTGPSWIS